MRKTTEQIREDLKGKVKFTIKAEPGKATWENVIVTAHYNDLKGHAYLSKGRYDSEEEFMLGGYYEEMQQEAIEQLLLEIEFAVKQVAEFV